MKKKRELQNSSSITTRTFGKGMIKDLNNSLLPEGSYIHARNAVNNSKSGDMGVIENEPSNLYCTKAPYTIIGTIHLYEDKWAIFSTDDINSEIGYFEEDSCVYRTVINDPCLNFKKSNLIIGVSRENFKCEWVIYWADALNPDRYMSMDNPPFIQIPDPNNTDLSCDVTINSSNLDCEKLRISKLTDYPCIKIKPAGYGGELLNGTYQVVMAYLENGERVTDYSKGSNILSMFDHSNVNGNIEISLTNLDKNYDYFELVLISFINNKLVAHKIGDYSTNFSTISIDKIPADTETIPIQLLSLMIPSYEKSDGIYKNGEYLLRIAPTTKFEFNYQPLANQIESEYVVVEYDKRYYREAGKNVGYMRDEVYPFFIRWIYNTGEKTHSFHIPGRSLTPSELTNVPSTVYGGTEYFFESTNTAGVLTPDSGTTDDGGVIIGKGTMAGWQSTEKYPDDKPEIWGNLCGEYIRHHKFPDNLKTNHYKQGGDKINVLGVRFKNIPFPIDNYGNPIPGIIGYEILRGDREGNKTILAKGLINNMGYYTNDDNEDIFYQNYPYNDLRYDPYLSKTFVNKDNPTPLPLGGSRYTNNYNSFHSPDTQFKHPFLSAKELKIYNNPYGQTEGVFNIPEKHPKFKIINNTAFFISILVGLGLSFKDLKGKEKAVIGNVNNNDSIFVGPNTNAVSTGVNIPFVTSVNTAITAIGTGYTTGGESLASLFGFSGANKGSVISSNLAVNTALALPGISGTRYYEYDPVGSGLPGPLKITNSLTSFLAFWGQHTDDFLNIIRNFSKFHNYVVSYQSHAFYNYYVNENKNGIKINKSSYIKDKIHEFNNIKINNLFRNGFITLNLNTITGFPTTLDDSRNLMSEITNYSGTLVQGVNEDNFGRYFKQGTASSFYGALKQRLRNQYGQLNNIKQVPASDCFKIWEIDTSNPPNATSDVIFGGDTYIGRYTEKNTFFYFFDWLYDSPDDFEYDYLLRKMLPYPTYWMNTLHYQINDFFNGVFDWLCNGSGGSVSGNADTSGILPKSFHNFDTGTNTTETTNPNDGLCTPINLVVKNAVMYLFNSGVRDFFVESEINVEYRDWGDREDQRHYDPYNHIDYAGLFKTSIIKDVNYFKYDYSLSISRFYQAHYSYSIMHDNNYDPTIAETCYSYYKKRIIYSLPNTKESTKDNWLVYLVDNKKDFTSEISSVKPIAKTGALILFKNESPIQFTGVDTLETGAGTKITIGDGGLFNQALQNIVNTDSSYEYGSCQNRLSVINTPAGLFWISQNQGKVFQYTGQLEEISQNGMKWWFEEFLPYKLLEQFPNFQLVDNAVIGLGTQSIYDNDNSVLYISKKDFVVKKEYIEDIIYLDKDIFSIRGAIIRLGDPRYFDNASWTVSYDVKTKSWISFHDWHPTFMLPSKNSFMTINNESIWKHNVRCDSYCNFYNVDYPFEVELVNPTGQNVNTLKSIEYLMEVYQWDINCVDRHHVLDFNFDRAYIYNTEQVSGELRLNLKPKNNIPVMLSYPRINNTSIDILYSKEEHKYKFNQFWDITDDRGEFSLARRMIWNTSPNGYIKSLNNNNLNYYKNPLERKKFRHYESVLLLKRLISGNHNMQLKLINSKNQYSFR